MRLPHSLTDSIFFALSSARELIAALGEYATEVERDEIERLSNLGLPPVTSRAALSTLVGVNPGLVWSFLNRPHRHYRVFEIRKGKKARSITAPKVGLKVVQKWLSVHLQRTYFPPEHVFGFIPGRSHVDAASVHTSARWVLSVDIENFFPTTPKELVELELQRIGYSSGAAQIISGVCCLGGFLPQGSPASPVLSNLAFREVDSRLNAIAGTRNIRLSRYADDIVFSGKEEFLPELKDEVFSTFEGTPWGLSPLKTKFAAWPERLKVHGLLVNSEGVRLTKRYRNKIRAYEHVLETRAVSGEDSKRLRGHVLFGKHVAKYYPASSVIAHPGKVG